MRGQARTDLRQAGKDFSKPGSASECRCRGELLHGILELLLVLKLHHLLETDMVRGPLLRGILNLPPPLLAGVLELLLASGVHIGLCSGFSDAGMQDIYLCVLYAESNGMTAAPSPSSACCLNECPPLIAADRELIDDAYAFSREHGGAGAVVVISNDTGGSTLHTSHTLPALRIDLQLHIRSTPTPG